MTQRIRCAGFGGQGIVLMGRLIAHSAMVEEKQNSDRIEEETVR